MLLKCVSLLNLGVVYGFLCGCVVSIGILVGIRGCLVLVGLGGFEDRGREVMCSIVIGSIVLVLFLGLVVVLVQVVDVVGVVFVYGIGVQINVIQDYWQLVIIDIVCQGLLNSSNYVVINCDFIQYMWKLEVVGCLVNQLISFIDSRGIIQLVVIIYFNGGNVVCWILFNLIYDSCYLKIICMVCKVIVLVLFLVGMLLVDVVFNGNIFEILLGWLLGYKNDVVCQQQVVSMVIYNVQNLYGMVGCLVLFKLFCVVVGSDVELVVWDSNSYCGGYVVNVGLEFIQNWLLFCFDGFLECSSQKVVGIIWFIDMQCIQGVELFSYNQSCCECFGLGILLCNDLIQ